MRMQKIFLSAVVLVLFLAGLPVLGSWSVYKRLESRLDLKIQGRFSPRIFASAFDLNNAQFEWNGKVLFEKGDLKVEYNPFSFFLPQGLRVRLTGKNLQVRLLGDWAKMQGVEKADLQKFEADFSLGRKGLNEIYCVEVQSQVFQFQLKKSEDNSIADSRGKNS